MKIGDLNCRVRFQKPRLERDAAGQRVEHWDDIGEAWASIKAPSGMGAITSMQDNVPASITLYSIRVRFREDLMPGMRALYRGQVFRIKKVMIDYASRQHTDLVCEVGAPT